MMIAHFVRDRRRHVRMPLERPVKVRSGVTGRYIAGRTVDISDGGCLLRLEGFHHLAAGQSVRVGIAYRPGQSLLLADDMLEGTVVRRLGHGDTQHVAITFENANTLAEAV